MKTKIFLFTIVVFLLSSCKCYVDESEWVIRKIEIELVTGTKKIVYYKIPPYADVSISSSHGSYRMSTWKYTKICVKQEVTLMYGVAYCRIIE
jgi:hypothetical protein